MAVDKGEDRQGGRGESRHGGRMATSHSPAGFGEIFENSYIWQEREQKQKREQEQKQAKHKQEQGQEQSQAMIVYNDTKRQFVEDVKFNAIADKILDLVRSRGINAGHDKEYASWQNSMNFMRNVVDDTEIDDDVRIAIEYNIPLTSKRVDFIISGADEAERDNIVIVELKQWQKAEIVDDQMHYSVRTLVGGADRIVCHPSYQAWSYATFISNYSEEVASGSIGIAPCAYLHNYSPDHKDTLADSIYRDWYEAAPFFVKNEVPEFSAFIKKFIRRRSSRGDILYCIENGRLRPTKSLQDALASMVRGNAEFTLLDEQAVCMDMCLKTLDQCRRDGRKRTIAIQGGPGTGKSVLAVNFLMEALGRRMNASYVTKNSAPRQAFLSLLTEGRAAKRATVEHLFRSPFGLSNCARNSYDCLIVDEAHRLVSRMYGDWNGENQVKECIEAALLTVFLLDEDQAITTKDIGSMDEIRHWCKECGSRLISTPETRLVSQFRCNGSDAYIQFLDGLLQRTGESVPVSLDELNFDFRVFDDPCAMREALREKNALNGKARMVAGYCYDWNVKNRRGPFDIEIGDFRAQWNLEGDKIWAVNKNSFEQVGCIHTAQGLEFDYVGVIIGRDLRYDPATGRVVTDRTAISRDDKSSGIRSSSDQAARRLILNTYKTLLTRGQKGCYVYCEDEALREWMKGRSR